MLLPFLLILLTFCVLLNLTCKTYKIYCQLIDIKRRYRYAPLSNEEQDTHSTKIEILPSYEECLENNYKNTKNEKSVCNDLNSTSSSQGKYNLLLEPEYYI
ncbi:hypothetical protein U3516DRAFT_901879 [Neocallimastix sp. 'constans']